MARALLAAAALLVVSVLVAPAVLAEDPTSTVPETTAAPTTEAPTPTAAETTAPAPTIVSTTARPRTTVRSTVTTTTIPASTTTAVDVLAGSTSIESQSTVPSLAPTTSLTGVNGTTPSTQKSTAADDPAQSRLRLIIIAFFVLAAVILVATVVFWRRTRPVAGPSVTVVATTVQDRAPASGEVASPLPDPERPIIPPVVVPESLRDVPMWSDDDPAPR